MSECYSVYTMCPRCRTRLGVPVTGLPIERYAAAERDPSFRLMADPWYATCPNCGWGTTEIWERVTYSETTDQDPAE